MMGNIAFCTNSNFFINIFFLIPDYFCLGLSLVRPCINQLYVYFNRLPARQIGNIHTACQDTGDLHNVKKNIFVSIYQNIPTLYRILKTCSFIQTTMSNLCSDEPILDSKQLYNTIENSQNTLKTETIIRTDTKEHI